MKNPTRLLIVALTLTALPAYANPGKGNKGGNSGKGNQKQEKHEKKEKIEKEQKFDKLDKKEKIDKPSSHQHGDDDALNDTELGIILSLFRKPDGSRQLPPGLAMNAKRGKPLPPGWQKKLARGSRIDDDLWDILTPISYDRLPGVRRVPNTGLYYHENRVLRVANATREILDVITLD